MSFNIAMTPAVSSMIVPQQLQTLKGSSENDAAPQIGKQYDGQLSISNGPIPPGMHDMPKKPMRPLTAYHIFFQIERDFIIQTTAGEDADKSIHDNKVYLDDVPRRYAKIKLLPDWYAGPGKRRKRKHRKQHGKIGFLELSRVISARWARLEDIDPETKVFVHRVAQAELDEYYRDTKRYKELTKDLVPEAAKQPVSRPVALKKKIGESDLEAKYFMQTIAQEKHYENYCEVLKQYKELSKDLMPEAADPISFPAAHKNNDEAKEYNSKDPSFPVQQPPPMVSRGEMAMASYQPVHLMPPNPVQLENDINYFLSCVDKNTQHLMPPSFGIENQVQRKRKMFQQQDCALPLSNFDPRLEPSNYRKQPRKNQCPVVTAPTSPTSVVNKPTKRPRVVSTACINPTVVEVDLCDDEIRQLWRSHNY